MSDNVKIGLVMIVKNESKVILRCLQSVLPIISHYTIVDTGSQDYTVDIIKNFFAEKNIPGEVHHFKCPPEDEGYYMFDEWRNLAVEKAKGKTDFCFTLDADEQLVLPKNFHIHQLKSQLTKVDMAGVDLHNGGFVYVRNAIWRSYKSFRYFAPVHEVLMCDNPYPQTKINGLYVQVTSDGASWDGDEKKKYLGHAKSLHRWIEKNGEEPRIIFYLAQSYRDAGEKEKAIEWYEKRINMGGGYQEEIYWSQFQIAKLKWDLKKPVGEVADEFMKCFEYDDLRAEHIQQLKHLYERNSRPKSALKADELLNKYIGRNPYPARGLFIDPSAYEKYVPPPKNTLDDLFDSLPSAWKGHREFASWLVNEMKPKNIVALGVDWGYSTFCLAVPNIGKVYGIDHFEGDVLTGIRNTHKDVLASAKWLKEKHKISNIEIIKDRFDNVAKRWNPKNKIDILHIDGYPSELKNDYDKWLPSVSENGVIMFHDTQSFGDVKKFFSELPLHKMEFTHSGGLGVASRDKSTIDKIKNKYFPPLEKITIAYIAHDTEVFDKYLRPSLKNLNGNFEIISISSKGGMPAANYNHMLDMSNNRYVLFVHEDTTFSPDFLDKISETIRKHPDFGVIGAVGNYENNIQWSKENEIMEVKTVDCCCILVNKEHGLKFDSETFSDFHLYVDDYCLQTNAKGLKNYTIPINAYEASKDDIYSSDESYFRHHSATVNRLGFCWGNYWEYKSRMDKKWKGKDTNEIIMPNGGVIKNPSYSIIDGEKKLVGRTIYKNSIPIGHVDSPGAKVFTGPTGIMEQKALNGNWQNQYEVDVCIVSYAKTEELKRVTELGIKTLLESEDTIKFNVFVVESNPSVKYDFPNTQTLYPASKFNYNAYLNWAASAGRAPYVFLANNDLSYTSGWASAIIMEMEKNPLILSASPFCPQTQNRKDFPNDVYVGSTVRKELAGWAIFQQRKIYDIIGQICEEVEFWFSDNVLADQMLFHGVMHALVTGSVVNHHDKNLGTTGSSILDQSKMNEYTTGQYQKYIRAREKLFNSTKVLDFYA